jgi:hypothetical protein
MGVAEIRDLNRRGAMYKDAQPPSAMPVEIEENIDAVVADAPRLLGVEIVNMIEGRIGPDDVAVRLDLLPVGALERPIVDFGEDEERAKQSGMDDVIVREEPYRPLGHGARLGQIAAHRQGIAQRRPRLAIIRCEDDQFATDREASSSSPTLRKVCASLSIVSRCRGFARRAWRNSAIAPRKSPRSLRILPLLQQASGNSP